MSKTSKRRANGEGTFYRDKKTNNWVLQVTFGTKADGSIERKAFSGKTQTICRERRDAYEAKRKEEAFFDSEEKRLMQERRLNALRMGHSLESEEMFVEAFPAWLALYKSPPNKKPTTYGTYLDIYRCHFGPFFEKHRLFEITQDILQSYYNSKQKSGARSDGKTGSLSPKTIRNHHMLLKEFFDYALIKYKLPYNPTSGTQRPEVHTPPMRVLDPNEMLVFMQEVFRETQRVAILTGLFTGMRIGELLALEVSDVLTEKQAIWVNKNIVRVKTETIDKENPNIVRILNHNPDKHTHLIVQGTPKTKDSNREIPIPDVLFEMLVKHLYFLQQSGWPNFHNLLFPSTKGGYIDPKSYEIRLTAVSSRCDIKKVNPHALRHTLATRLCENDVAITTVKSILGHSSITTTQKYVTTFSEEKRDAMDTVTTLLNPASFFEAKALSGTKKRMAFADVILPTFAAANPNASG